MSAAFCCSIAAQLVHFGHTRHCRTQTVHLSLGRMIMMLIVLLAGRRRTRIRAPTPTGLMDTMIDAALRVARLLSLEPTQIANHWQLEILARQRIPI